MKKACCLETPSIGTWNICCYCILLHYSYNTLPYSAFEPAHIHVWGLDHMLLGKKNTLLVEIDAVMTQALLPSAAEISLKITACEHLRTSASGVVISTLFYCNMSFFPLDDY